MLLIEDVWYYQCGNCFAFRLLEDMRWNDELLSWVCYDPACLS